MKTAVIGFPRIGENRELKKITESYFKGEISKEELLKAGDEIKLKHWNEQKKQGIDFITSNDFSYYDIFLDTCFMLNIIPKRYKELGIDEIDTYFAMARGYQKQEKDVKALPMKKWFNTNYHYVIPEYENNMEIILNSKKIKQEFLLAKENGIDTKPVVIGIFTMFRLLNIDIANEEAVNKFIKVYVELLNDLNTIGVEYLQIDEPYLVMDLSSKEKALFESMYEKILENKANIKVLLQTYFGDIRDIYENVIFMKFDAIGLDFVEGEKTLELIEKYNFPYDKILFAGIVNGKNIWKNNYEKSINILLELEKLGIKDDKIVLNTSCSLLHVPYTVKNEKKLEEKYKIHLAFALEKLEELIELKNIKNNQKNDLIIKNKEIHKTKTENKEFYNQIIREKVKDIDCNSYWRKVSFNERIKLQRKKYNIGLLPTTTIGSFPQTKEIRTIRNELKKGIITFEEYKSKIEEKMKRIVEFQDRIGIDILVHGEYERNDMVEYFGENLSGFIFTENGWVQSYGTRGVKPPVIFGDIKREKDITVEWTVKAQSYTNKPMKGMLTGPVTILNWSFPREDISLKEITYQIAEAIKDEVLALEKAGIGIIQIDEAALREKLPLRKENWKKDYLNWAIKSFRYVSYFVKPETQIHTHMCYSEFEDILYDIKEMDADVITIESAKSDLKMLDTLSEYNYNNEVGPGVYDIHSPRVPSIQEFKDIIIKMSKKISKDKLWVNPDCGLKTRGEIETFESLENMVEAVKLLRKEI